MSNEVYGVMPPALPPSPQDVPYPKWVKVDESHVIRKQIPGMPDVISTPCFTENHVNRVDGEVTVLVNNEDEESVATSTKADETPVLEPVVESAEPLTKTEA